MKNARVGQVDLSNWFPVAAGLAALALAPLPPAWGQNGAWEDKHGAWRFSAEHWLQDLILLDMETKKTTNLTRPTRRPFSKALPTSCGHTALLGPIGVRSLRTRTKHLGLAYLRQSSEK